MSSEWYDFMKTELKFVSSPPASPVRRNFIFDFQVKAIVLILSDCPFVRLSSELKNE